MSESREKAEIGTLFGEAARAIREVRNRSQYYRSMKILLQYEQHLSKLAASLLPIRECTLCQLPETHGGIEWDDGAYICAGCWHGLHEQYELAQLSTKRRERVVIDRDAPCPF